MFSERFPIFSDSSSLNLPSTSVVFVLQHCLHACSALKIQAECSAISFLFNMADSYFLRFFAQGRVACVVAELLPLFFVFPFPQLRYTWIIADPKCG